MSTIDRVRHLGRRVFGATKRPVWLAAHALTGRRIQATAHFIDLGMYGGYFEARAEPLRARLPPGFDVVERRAGWTELEVWCAEYRRVDVLRPYNELSVIVPVRFAAPGAASFTAQFVMHMQVTTEEARWTGADNYGFPKVLADVRFRDEQGLRVATAVQAGRHVMTLRVDTAPTEHFLQQFRLLNVRDDGIITSCTFDLEGERAISDHAGGVSLELGQHAIADQLREIDLQRDSGRRLYVPQARAVLSKATEIGRLPRFIEAPTARERATGEGERAGLQSI